KSSNSSIDAEVREKRRETHPQGRPHRSTNREKRSQSAARRPARKRDGPRYEFQKAQLHQDLSDESPRELVSHVVIADSQRARRKIPDDPDAHGSERRPPHPMDRQEVKSVFD